MSKCLWSRWKWYWGVNEIPSPFPCSPVIRVNVREKTPHRKKKKGNFKDPAKVGLVILTKIIIFGRFWNGSINLFGNTSNTTYFLNNTVWQSSYGLKISENREIKHIFLEVRNSRVTKSSYVRWYHSSSF